MQVISIARSTDVPNVLWSKVLAEWGTAGPDPNSVISTPIEFFLSNLDWVFEACRTYSTGIDWDDKAEEC